VQTDVMANGLDFYPTILSWTNTQKPEGISFDGSDLSELLATDATDPQLVKQEDGQVRDTLLWHFPNALALESTIRVGDYKLVRNYDHQNPKNDALELYQLYNTEGGKQTRVDIEEANNLAKKMPEKAQAMNAKLTEKLEAMDASYPYFNPYFKDALPHKETVPTVLSHQRNGKVVEYRYQENGAKLARAQLMYTLNGGAKKEEWFRTPAEVLPGNKVTATLPEGTTHYLINLIDENNFLVSYPYVKKSSRGNNLPSKVAPSVKENLKKK